MISSSYSSLLSLWSLSLPAPRHRLIDALLIVGLPQWYDSPLLIVIEQPMPSCTYNHYTYRMLTVPIIDFSRFSDAQQRLSLAREIDQASRSSGFFYVSHHGIAQELIDKTFKAAQDFFALPLEDKQLISINNTSKASKNFRGYFAIEQEKLDFALEYAGDYKEGLKIGRDLPEHHPLVQAKVPLHGANQWPQGLALWQETMNQYLAACQQLGCQLMSAFALALDADTDYFSDLLTEPMVTLAPLHYPPAPIGKISGAGAHSDYGCLTMVYQQDVVGLQVYDTSVKSWLDVPIIDNTLVVNIGDMLQRWSNNTYKSTPHRVVNNSQDDRYSLAFFFDPNFDASLQPIPGCVSKDNPPVYQDMTAGAYMLDRMNSSFFS